MVFLLANEKCSGNAVGVAHDIGTCFTIDTSENQRQSLMMIIILMMMTMVKRINIYISIVDRTCKEFKVLAWNFMLVSGRVKLLKYRG